MFFYLPRIMPSRKRVCITLMSYWVLCACHPMFRAGAQQLPQLEKASSVTYFVNSIGINTHLNYFDRTYGNFPLVSRELQSLGAKNLRDGIHLQNQDYNNAVYGRWAQLAALGIRFDASLDPRSSLGQLTPGKLAMVDDLAGGGISTFEGPNELDISNLPDWSSVDSDYQKQIYEEVKSMTAGSTLQVVGPSMAAAKHGASVGNISAYLDYGNLHPYPAGQMPSAIFPEQLALAQSISGQKPIVVTETGYHNALNDHHDQPAVSEAAAAKYVPRLFLENFAHGIVRTYLYELMDEAPNPALDDEQLHWGLLRSDGSEKPAFTALQNLITELSDTVQPSTLQTLAYALVGATPEIHHLLLQKSDGQFFLILWQEVPSYDTQAQRDISNPAQPVTLQLSQAAKSIALYEPATQASPLGSQNNVKQISLDVPDQPLVVQVTP